MLTLHVVFQTVFKAITFGANLTHKRHFPSVTTHVPLKAIFVVEFLAAFGAIHSVTGVAPHVTYECFTIYANFVTVLTGHRKLLCVVVTVMFEHFGQIKGLVTPVALKLFGTIDVCPHVVVK